MPSLSTLPVWWQTHTFHIILFHLQSKHAACSGLQHNPVLGLIAGVAFHPHTTHLHSHTHTTRKG